MSKDADKMAELIEAVTRAEIHIEILTERIEKLEKKLEEHVESPHGGGTWNCGAGGLFGLEGCICGRCP